MFQTDRTVQPSLFAFSHWDLVSGDSDVWLYMDLFSVLDLSDFEAAYEFQGQAAKEPQLMLQVLFYGLTHGIVSGRKLQAFCRNDNRFIVLSGNLRPDRRTFDRFIKRHNDRFKKLFVQVVRLSQRMGLVSLGRIAIDGSKFKGAADKAMAYGSMDRAIVHIEDNLVKLKQELAQANNEEATDLEDKLSNELVRQEVRRHRIAAAKAAIDEDFARRKSTGYLAFKLAKNFCDGCQAPCMAYGKKHPEVLDDADRQWFNDYLAYSRSAEWKKAYKQRKAIVEPVFGNIRNKGIKIFVRGRKAVSAWWNITTTAHNIEKVIKHIGRQTLTT